MVNVIEDKLWSNNFRLVIFGQSISLFANAILRFAISLYVLQETGSIAIFSGINALAMIPTIIFSPIGGILADKLNRQRIMVALDVISGLLTIALWLFIGKMSLVPLITAVLMLFSVLSSFESPTVSSSIPLIVSKDNLMKGNAVVSQIQAISELLGPIIGGFLFGILGFSKVLIISFTGFFCAALIELFIKIPSVKKSSEAKQKSSIFSDFMEGARFVTKENPIVFKILLIAASLNLFFSGLLVIGMPNIVKLVLGLSDQLYGTQQGIMGLGSIVGGLMIGRIANKIDLKKSWKLLLFSSIMIIPTAIVLALGFPSMSIYIVMTASMAVLSGLVTMFNVSVSTFAQSQTPPQMLGRVSSFLSTVSLCAFPLGQFLYGRLFTIFLGREYIPFFFAAIMSIGIALYSARVFSAIATPATPATPAGEAH